MTDAVSAYAAMGAKGKLESFAYEHSELAADEVRLDVTHCGICYSDVDAVDDTHGGSQYPLVPGHEIVGIVSAVGANVAHLAAGQRVGVGPICSSCHHCNYCISARENLCPELQFTISGGNHGGFSSSVQVDGAFAFPIPDALSSRDAAPLLCAGLTVFSPLRDHISPGMNVGVIGIGGLGHLAIQFADKMGAQVTAFSSSPGKENEARSFGASNFVVASDANQMAQAANTQDFILSTTYAPVSWAQYLEVLRPDGKICIVGASMSPIDVPGAMLIMKQSSIVGSAAGGRMRAQQMLNFAAEHGVRPQIEVLPMSEKNANVGFARVRNNDVRYRMVLEAK